MTDTTEIIQQRSDRSAAEFHRLVDTPLPDGWLQVCMDAGFPGLPADMTIEEAQQRIQAIVDAALPLHEELVREQVASELEQQAHQAAVADVDGTECVEARTWTTAAKIARRSQ